MFRLTGRYRTAQASIEFMLLFVLFLVAVTFAMIVSINQSYSISSSQVDLEAGNLLSLVADRINTAYLEGDGFSIKVTLPERILRNNYTLNISSNEAILRMEGSTYIRYLLTNRVTGVFEVGTNTITNRMGEIVIGV